MKSILEKKKSDSESERTYQKKKKKVSNLKAKKTIPVVADQFVSVIILMV